MNSALEGSFVRLRAIEHADYQLLGEWLCDDRVTRYIVRGTPPPTAEELESAYRDVVASKVDLEFGVLARETGSCIGIAGLHQINWIARHAEFRVLLGDVTSWGRGAGTEVVRLLTAYGFEALNLNKVWLGVNADNHGARRTYEKSGYMVEGSLREEVYRLGRFADIVRMSVLREEYERARESWPKPSDTSADPSDSA